MAIGAGNNAQSSPVPLRTARVAPGNLFRRMSAQAMGMEATSLCHRSHWVPKSSRSICSNCKRNFRLWAGKHHCRLCGEIVCGACSTKRILFQKKSVRTCDDCVDVNVQNISEINRRQSTPEFLRSHTSPAMFGEFDRHERHSLQTGPLRAASSRGFGRRSFYVSDKKKEEAESSPKAFAVLDYCSLYRVTFSWQSQMMTLIIAPHFSPLLQKDIAIMEEIGLPTVAGDDEPLVPVAIETKTDLYAKFKSLERHLEFLDIQESYIKDEMKNLKRELIRAKEEVKRIQSVPLVIGQFLEMVDANYGIVGSTAGSNYYVRILSTLDRERLKPNSSVALHRHSHAVVDVLPPESDSSIQMMQMSERPDVSYSDIGGMDIQKQEVREAVELPLTHFDLYKQIGVDPPRGVLMYGPPGTGKTMLAKAVANATTAAFISVVGSEFVQKYLGEGPRMVRDVFRLAKENSPAIVFIDEVDAIATKRFDAQTGADREVQRILLELLNQMDGFDQATNVKVIMATNRADTLDPALLRPGRLDRKIEFPLPDRRQKRLIYQACTANMNLGDEVDLEDYVNRPEKISSADIASICQEAGLQAVRKNRYVVLPKDFDKGYKNAIKRADTTFEFYH
ncbi:hypothetical protein BBO99_00003367 [Phytophthora kernoviae]|uniref:FYVE-type domain-containing protein n=2 Tax=Phytophthora kernoviae TaxID=325452 RepID=A0A3R7K0X0_9STRA|nr:hypothetical protein G195_004063 [Phytophthora kernoviae 00238/432]KAG2528087.1 hypothetical protein JM16_003066 [Phytophthora kernoviae]KAG2529800.1 hypothetical protein JM18_002683 [Phytophthora kernoviae]RLN32671.1 hypothetical protein BBI17_002103 [Phytophthora kernoviae]RLN81830.1 hypothetical protein BBO99_00003367 [Phytophthora kernoviae]